jgi:hypothetical protein
VCSTLAVIGIPIEDSVQRRSLVAATVRVLAHGLNANIVVWEGGHPFWRGETDLQTVLSTLLGQMTASAA